MKRFFLKTGVYAGYVFLLWTSTHLFNTCTGSDKFDYKKKVVILGDSHAELGINPKESLKTVSTIVCQLSL